MKTPANGNGTITANGADVPPEEDRSILATVELSAADVARLVRIRETCLQNAASLLEDMPYRAADLASAAQLIHALDVGVRVARAHPPRDEDRAATGKLKHVYGPDGRCVVKHPGMSEACPQTRQRQRRSAAKSEPAETVDPRQTAIPGAERDAQD